MTIAQYLKVLRQHWALVMVLTMAGALGAAAYTLVATPVYQADMQLFVSTSGQATDVADLSQGGTFVQQRVKSYTQLITSPGVLDPVIQKLGLRTTASELSGQVTSTSPLDTVLIDVNVSDTSPQRAADIANTIGATFPDLVNSLETPNGRTDSPVKVTVTRRAVAPAAPVSPRKSLNVALGLLVGLGLGVGLAVLRDSLDRTIGSKHQAGKIAGAPVLGAIAEDPQFAKQPLLAAQTLSPRGEAYRHLRTNIRFLSVDHDVRSLVVTGSVPNEGKTSTAANLAIALAQNGENVVLIDGDLRRPAIADLFGLPGGVGLTSLLLGDASPELALQRWRDDLPLRVLTSGPIPPNPSELISSDRMQQLIRALTDQGVTVVIDSPPLLPVTDAAVLARHTDGALVVVRTASTRVEQLTAATETLQTARATVLGIVLNRVPKRGKGYGSYGYGYGSYDTYAPSTPPTPPTPPPLAAQHYPDPAPVPETAPVPGTEPANGVTLLDLSGPDPHADHGQFTSAYANSAYINNGHVYSAYVNNGHVNNGHVNNGAPVNGAPVNGSHLNGAPVNGTSVNGSGVNGSGVNGTGVNGTGVNGTGTGTRRDRQTPRHQQPW